MSTAIIATIIVIGLVAGLILTLRRSARTGMPSRDVLDRTTQRARDLAAQEKANQDKRDT